MESNRAEKLSLLSELIKLTRSDENEINEIELQFLMTIAQQLGIEQSEFQNLFENLMDFDPPTNEFDRILQFQRLILLSNVDLNQSEQEMNFIRESGVKMGLNPLAVNEVLNKIHDYENKVIPPNILIEIFMRHHN